MHIPKTAGTSLRLQVHGRLQGPWEFVGAYGLELCAARPNREWVEMVRGVRGQVRVVMGHYGWGARELLGAEGPAYGTMLREPVEKCASFFAHVSRHPPARPGRTIKDLLRQECAPELNNHYVRSLLGSERCKVALGPGTPSPAPRIEQVFEEAMLEEAWERLCGNFRWVGFAEDYEASVDRLAGEMGWGSLGAAPRENRRPAGEGDDAPLDEETAELIERYNRLDLELYRRAWERWGPGARRAPGTGDLVPARGAANQR